MFSKGDGEERVVGWVERLSFLEGGEVGFEMFFDVFVLFRVDGDWSLRGSSAAAFGGRDVGGRRGCGDRSRFRHCHVSKMLCK